VIPWRLSSNCRRFGTHCRFDLHRQVNEVCQWMDCVGYLYLIGLERGSGRANRKLCARTGRVEVQQVVEGEGVYTPSPSTTCWTFTRPVWAHYFLLALPLPRSNPIRYKYPTQSIHWHTSFTCLWRSNWQWVPKRRQLELRRRGITQKGTNRISDC